MPLPLLGNMPAFIWHSPGYSFFQNCKRNYGNVYTVWMGSKPMVCIANLNLMKETFVKDGDSYIGKTDLGMNKAFRGGNYGIAEAVGDLWREHRRFALHQMRDLGLGKMKMEERIITEVEELTKTLLEKEDVDIYHEFHYHVANVINQMLHGYRFDGHKKSEFDYLMALMKKQNENKVLAIPILLPWTRNLPILNKIWKGFLDFRDEFFGFFQKQIDRHITELDFDAEESTDYVEAYLKEKKKRETEGDFETFKNMSGIVKENNHQLINVCFDLWSAGLGTTTSTMCWGIFYLMHFPDVQTKMHEEMDREIGSSRIITTADKNNLLYTQAVINEVQRALNMVVLNLPHATTREVVVEGYKLPKDTTIIAQVMHVMYDDEFEEMLPFSLGKRQCPGEGLARMELFLFFANLCNRFKFTSRGDLPPLKKTFKNIQQPVGLVNLKATPRFG